MKSYPKPIKKAKDAVNKAYSKRLTKKERIEAIRMLSPIRKTRKIKRVTITSAKKKANTAFSIYIRTRDQRVSGEAGMVRCVSCRKLYPAFGVGCAQAGHFIPGRHSNVLYDERNCHAQCYMCNVVLKGNWVKYEEFMIAEYGNRTIAELKELDKYDPHYKVEDYQEKERYFKEKLESLNG